MPLTDYESEQDQIRRMLAQAQQLRAQGSQGAGPGQMVSGWYVKPSWTQQLAPLVSSIMGARKERQAEDAQKGLSDRMQSDYSTWMKERPLAKTLSTPEEIPGTVAPGPMPEGQEDDTPHQVRMTTQKTQPTTQDQLSWASRGMQNPLSRSLAAQYMSDTMIKAPEREEARQFKADEAAKVREANSMRDIERHKNKLSELDLLYNDKSKTREQQLFIEKMKDQTKRDLGLAEAKARVDAAHEKALAAGANVKPVPNAVTAKMSEAEQAADGFNSAFATFKPEYGGLGGMAKAAAGRNPVAAAVTGLVAPETAQNMQESAQWWRNYENQAAMVKRHAMFGSAFTSAEQAAWDRATIKPGDTPEFIAKSLQEQTRLANIFYNKLRNQYVVTGHPQIGDAFPERASDFEPVTPSMQPQPMPISGLPVQRQPTQRRRSTDTPPGVTFEVQQ